jgi:RimJ/RimL family protein N-acetyltransferase
MELVAAHERFAEAFLKWRSEPDARRYNPTRPLTLDEARARLKACRSELSSLEPGIEYLTAEIGYIVGAEHHGRGLATSALRTLIARVFAETRVRKLIAMIHAENIASTRVAEKLGFKQEGLLREHYLIEGKPADELLYGLLRPEFSTGAP